MDIGDELRTAGLTVITGREGIGRTTDVTSIAVESTKTGQASEGAPDVNDIATPNRAVAYIERSGRVWLLAEGPVEGDTALVYVARYRDGDDLQGEQQDALDVVLAVLGAAYGLDAPGTRKSAAKPAQVDSAPDQTDTEVDS